MGEREGGREGGKEGWKDARKEGRQAGRKEGTKQASKQGSKEARKQEGKEARKQGRKERKGKEMTWKERHACFKAYEYPFQTNDASVVFANRGGGGLRPPQPPRCFLSSPMMRALFLQKYMKAQ